MDVLPKVYLAADHAGFRMKEALTEHLSLLGYEVSDLGAHELDPDDDYPDYALALANAVANDAGSRGIMCCGSGQGEAMAANRVSGVRAAVFYAKIPARDALDREGMRSEDGYDMVRLARRHNDANVLAIGARFVSPEEADDAVRIFLSTAFSDDPRHARRVAKF